MAREVAARERRITPQFTSARGDSAIKESSQDRRSNNRIARGLRESVLEQKPLAFIFKRGFQILCAATDGRGQMRAALIDRLHTRNELVALLQHFVMALLGDGHDLLPVPFQHGSLARGFVVKTAGVDNLADLF